MRVHRRLDCFHLDEEVSNLPCQVSVQTLRAGVPEMDPALELRLEFVAGVEKRKKAERNE